MKTTSLLLVSFTAVVRLAVLSLPAAAECWMTCPPGSTATPSGTGQQTPTAETEPVASPEAQKPVAKVGRNGQELASDSVGKEENSSASWRGHQAATNRTENDSSTRRGSNGLNSSAGQGGSCMQPPPAEPTRLLRCPHRLVRPQTPPPTAAFQPAPVQGAAPSPAPIPGPIPGTATMRVIPE